MAIFRALSIGIVVDHKSQCGSLLLILAMYLFVVLHKGSWEQWRVICGSFSNLDTTWRTQHAPATAANSMRHVVALAMLNDKASTGLTVLSPKIVHAPHWLPSLMKMSRWSDSAALDILFYFVSEIRCFKYGGSSWWNSLGVIGGVWIIVVCILLWTGVCQVLVFTSDGVASASRSSTRLYCGLSLHHLAFSCFCQLPWVL